MAENAKGRKVWLDGKIVDYNEAKVPILTHSLQYGSGIFEGIRAYPTKRGAAIFRLQEHVRRFQHTAKIYSMPLGYSDKELSDAIVATVKANGLDACYIRPFAFYNDDKIGISTTGKRVSVYIAAVPFGAYFGAAKERGIKCKISSWRRINSDILPVQAKSSGNYINSIMANNEARASGFEEAILLSRNGSVAEGPGENIFIVKEGELLTPDVGSDILLGITRSSLITIAEKLGISVVQREIHHEELYTADEVFFAGTAAEITPIVNIDGMGIGDGKPGRLTMMLAKKYDSIVHGNERAYAGWLTYVR